MAHHLIRPPARSLAFAAVLLSALAVPAAAQTSGRTPGQTFTNAPNATAANNQPDASPATAAVVELANEPFRIDSAGLSMYLPLGSLAQTTRLGEQAAVRITPPTPLGQRPIWIMNIQTVNAPAAQQSTEWLADRIIDQLRASGGRLNVDVATGSGGARSLESTRSTISKTAIQLLARDPALRVGESVADRAYLVVPAPGGEPVIHGHSVFHVADDRFVTFELITAQEFFPEVKPVYETTVATATFVDPTEAAARRFAAIQAGKLLIERFTEADYAAVVDGSAFGESSEGVYERWERLFTPGGTGREIDDLEHGYKRVQTWIGFRGEIEPQRSREGWTPAEREPGYLLKMQTRLIQPTPAGDQIVDSEATFFMSKDRNEEAWTIRMGLTDPTGAEVLWRETGARDGASVTIAVEEPGAPPRAIKPVIRGDGYVSRLEAFLLPHLIVRSGIVTEYGFYAYQPSLQTIAFRTDALEQPANMPGRYRLTTRLAEDLEPQTSTYESDGQLRQTRLPDGRTWQPIQFERLYRLWQSKDLPLD